MIYFLYVSHMVPSFQHCFSSWRFGGSSCTALLRSHHSISVRLRSWTLDNCNSLIIFFFRHSAVDLLGLGSVSCCMNQFQPSFSCQTHDLTFNSRILWLFGGLYGCGTVYYGQTFLLWSCLCKRSLSRSLVVCSD